ncbi:hypothetical protein, partial [Nocardia pseudovaccinii]|uniref:hypothetical protein n=1 Tax=Nocardia pseudovaccinii TaxID=189540 RepID=UPI001C3FC70E
AALAAALAELAPEDWAWLGLLYRGHAQSPDAALSRVLALAAARLGTADTRPRSLGVPSHRRRGSRGPGRCRGR